MESTRVEPLTDGWESGKRRVLWPPTPPRDARFALPGPGDDDDEDETPIGDPDEDDWEGEDWDEEDDEPLQATPRPPQGPGAPPFT